MKKNWYGLQIIHIRVQMSFVARIDDVAIKLTDYDKCDLSKLDALLSVGASILL